MKIVTFINLPIIETAEIAIKKSLNDILKAVCQENNVLISDVRKKNKKNLFVKPRREYCYLSCIYSGKTLESIGKEVSLKYCDVIYHRDVIIKWLTIPAYNLLEKFDSIKKRLSH